MNEAFKNNDTCAKTNVLLPNCKAYNKSTIKAEEECEGSGYVLQRRIANGHPLGRHNGFFKLRGLIDNEM